MTSDDLSTLLKKPVLVQNYSWDDLHETAAKYSYSSLIYSLMALKAKLEKNAEEEYYLNKAAIRIPDRKKLFQLLHEEQESVEAFSINDEDNFAQQVDFQKNLKDLPKEKFEVNNEGNLSTKIQVSEEKSEESIEEKPNEVNEFTAKTLSEIENSEAVFSKMGTGEEKITEEEISEELSENPNILIQKEAENIAEKSEKKSQEISAEKPLFPKKGTGKTDFENEPVKAKDGHSFTEWLSLMKQKQEKIERGSIFEEIQKEDDDLQNSLADIKQFSKKNQAAQPESDLEMVTETLAKIYELQKKYESAIRAYEQLMLKFPDKKAYFAARIENLKKLQ